MKKFLLEAGLADQHASADWWRKQLLDADYDHGNIWLKTGETRDGFRVANLVAKLVGENIVVQQDKLDFVKSKAAEHAARLQTAVEEAIQEANQMTTPGPH
jgi:hypothetical protein